MGLRVPFGFLEEPVLIGSSSRVVESYGDGEFVEVTDKPESNCVGGFAVVAVPSVDLSSDLGRCPLFGVGLTVCSSGLVDDFGAGSAKPEVLHRDLTSHLMRVPLGTLTGARTQFRWCWMVQDVL